MPSWCCSPAGDPPSPPSMPGSLRSPKRLARFHWGRFPTASKLGRRPCKYLEFLCQRRGFRGGRSGIKNSRENSDIPRVRQQLSQSPQLPGGWCQARGCRRRQRGTAGGPHGDGPRSSTAWWGFGEGELGQGLQPREASAAPLAPRPAVPLRREEEEEVGLVWGQPHLSCWPHGRGAWLALPASRPCCPCNAPSLAFCSAGRETRRTCSCG